MNCKNIPQVDKSNINLTYITHFYNNQENIDSVISLLKKYESMDPWLLDQIQFIIVDDGSPIKYEIPDFDLNLTWIKINDDIKWNQGGARNLGATYAKSDKIFMTDLDWEINEEAFRFMINKGNLGRTIYKVREDGRKKGHSNMWFISRARFLQFFGYNEEFSGGHGGEDYFFFKTQQYHGSIFRYMPFKCFSQNRTRTKKIDTTKSYHSLQRDPTRNDEIGKRVREEMKTYGAEQGYSRIFLNFTWDILVNKSRKITHYKKPIKKWWKPIWYIRWLFGY
jgi:hypothetical protein